MDEKEVTRWTRCTTVVDPLPLTDPSQGGEADAAKEAEGR